MDTLKIKQNITEYLKSLEKNSLAIIKNLNADNRNDESNLEKISLNMVNISISLVNASFNKEKESFKNKSEFLFNKLLNEWNNKLDMAKKFNDETNVLIEKIKIDKLTAIYSEINNLFEKE